MESDDLTWWHPEAVAIVKAIARYLPDECDFKYGGDGDLGDEIVRALSQWIQDGKPND